MRLLTYSAALCLSASTLALPARAADDIMVNGLHCNALCQSWLGAGQGTPKAAIRLEPPMATQEVFPANQSSPVRVSAAPPGPNARATRSQTASREMEPAPSAPAASIVGYAPVEPGSIRRPPVLPRAAIVDMAPDDRLVALPPVVSLPAIEISRLPRPLPSRVRPAVGIKTHPRSLEVAPAASPADQDYNASLQRPYQRRTLSSVDAGMEPGLKTLPRLSDIVAVHGSIMVETAEDRAVARRNLAELVKATTRPKQFKTGFADPASDTPVASGQVVGQAR